MAAIARQSLVAVGRHQVTPLSAVVCLHKRECSSNVANRGSNLAAYKRGRGGRSSFSGTVATVFGSTGFLGRYVVNKLGKIGSQVIIPYRADPYYVRHLRLAGDLGQILFQPFYLRDDESLRKCMQYSNVVINLIGCEYPTKNFDLDTVHIEGAARIARVAKELGVEKLIHVSAMNASADPQKIFMKGGSNFLRSKHYGEEAVRSAFPEATIMRPADMYGPEDRYFNYYTGMWRRSLTMMPMWKRGTQTVKMPVFVRDVAEGIIQAIQNPEAEGRTYECVGPHSYYLSEIVDYIYRCMRWDNFQRMPLLPTFRMKAALLQLTPTGVKVNAERLETEHISDILTDCPTLEDLGVELMRLEKRAPYELKHHRIMRHYEEAVGEFADPEPPVFIS